MVAWVVLLLLTVSSASRFVFHNRMDVPEPWQRVGRAHGLQRQEITIALKQQNLALLNEIFVNVSDPQNSMYGQFLSREEILDIVSPPQHQVHRVLDWLHTYGIDRVSIKVLGDVLLFLYSKACCTLNSTTLST
jgi:tripeptidyl-peptidase-1